MPTRQSINNQLCHPEPTCHAEYINSHPEFISGSQSKRSTKRFRTKFGMTVLAARGTLPPIIYSQHKQLQLRKGSRPLLAQAQNVEYSKIHVCPQNQPDRHTEALAEVSNKQSSNKRFFGRLLPQNDRVHNKAAFTFAELLITLGIIGVVAALTIPGLVTKYTEKATVSSVKAVFSMLSQGFRLAIDEYGEVSTWCDIKASSDYDDCSAIIAEKLSHFVKMTPVTKYNVVYKNRFNNVHMTFTNNIWVLNNGTVLNFSSHNGDRSPKDWCKTSASSSLASSLYYGSCGYIFLDINGASLPNIDGRDVFKLHIYYDGLAPVGRKRDTIWVNSFNDQCMGKKEFTYFGSCTGWVIEKENMDYLHYTNLTY